MLINPWVRNYEKDDHAALSRVRAWAVNKLDGPVDYGFGYGTWVFIGTETVIKIDPEVGRPERFSHELAMSDLSIPGVATPRVLETGTLEGRAWVILNRIEGLIAYNVWPTDRSCAAEADGPTGRSAGPPAAVHTGYCDVARHI